MSRRQYYWEGQALAVLEAARRNGELPFWRCKRSLPAWATKTYEAQAA